MESLEAVAASAYPDEQCSYCVPSYISVFGSVPVEMDQIWQAVQPGPAGRIETDVLCSSFSPSDKAGAFLPLSTLLSPGQFFHSASAAFLSIAYYG